MTAPALPDGGRRAAASGDRPPVASGPLELYPASYAAVVDGVRIAVTATEFDLLYHLVSGSGRLFSAVELYRRVWEGDPLDCVNTVRVHVMRLRRKLGSHAGLIATLKGRGYRWDGPAELPPPVPDGHAAGVAMGLAEGVCAVARVLAGMPEAGREVALKVLRADPAVRWMAGGAP